MLPDELIAAIGVNLPSEDIPSLMYASRRFQRQFTPTYYQHLKDRGILHCPSRSITLVNPGAKLTALKFLADMAFSFSARSIAVHLWYIAYYPDAIASIIKGSPALENLIVQYGYNTTHLFTFPHLPWALRVLYQKIPESLHTLEYRKTSFIADTDPQHFDYWGPPHSCTQQHIFQVPLPGPRHISSLSVPACLLTNPHILRILQTPKIFHDLVDMTIGGIRTQDQMDLIASHLPGVETLTVQVEYNAGPLSFVLRSAPRLWSFYYEFELEGGTSLFSNHGAISTPSLHLPPGVATLQIPCAFARITFGDPTLVRSLTLASSAACASCGDSTALSGTLAALKSSGLSNAKLTVCVPDGSEMHTGHTSPFSSCPCWLQFASACERSSFDWIEGLRLKVPRFHPTIYVCEFHDSALLITY